MSIAPREAKCSSARRMRAGHETFSQRYTTSPSGRCSALPQAGHSVGITQGCGLRTFGEDRARPPWG